MENIVKKLSSSDEHSTFNQLVDLCTKRNSNVSPEHLASGSTRTCLALSSSQWQSTVIRIVSRDLWMASQPPQTQFDLLYSSNALKLTESLSTAGTASKSECLSSNIRSQHVEFIIGFDTVPITEVFQHPPCSLEVTTATPLSDTIASVHKNDFCTEQEYTESAVKVLEDTLTNELSLCLLSDSEFEGYRDKHLKSL